MAPTAAVPASSVCEARPLASSFGPATSAPWTGAPGLARPGGLPALPPRSARTPDRALPRRQERLAWLGPTALRGIAAGAVGQGQGQTQPPATTALRTAGARRRLDARLLTARYGLDPGPCGGHLRHQQ